MIYFFFWWVELLICTIGFESIIINYVPLFLAPIFGLAYVIIFTEVSELSDFSLFKGLNLIITHRPYLLLGIWGLIDICNFIIGSVFLINYFT